MNRIITTNIIPQVCLKCLIGRDKYPYCKADCEVKKNEN
jgi:hypothetical protein